jgi:hypothetical protein
MQAILFRGDQDLPKVRDLLSPIKIEKTSNPDTYMVKDPEGTWFLDVGKWLFKNEHGEVFTVNQENIHNFLK